MRSAASATIPPKTPRAIASGFIARCALDVCDWREVKAGNSAGSTRAISLSTFATFRGPPSTRTPLSA